VSMVQSMMNQIVSNLTDEISSGVMMDMIVVITAVLVFGLVVLGFKMLKKVVMVGDRSEVERERHEEDEGMGMGL